MTLANSRFVSRSFFICSAMVLLLAPAVLAQKTVTVSTVAGGFINDGQPATSAALNAPTCAAEDSKGNLYISDSTNNRIRKVSTTGVITTIAGTGIAGYSGDGGPAQSATLNSPACVVIDAQGDLLFADINNSRVRRIDNKGIIRTVAGNGTATWTGDNGPAAKAGVGWPWGLAFDSVGNLYISQQFQYVIRKVDKSGIIHTVAGNGTQGFGGVGDGGPATSASLNYPEGIVFDSVGNLYIADTDENRVRKVDTTGIITTFAGNGNYYCGGDGGTANQASILFPVGLTFYNGALAISATCSDSVRDVNLSSNIINGVAGLGSGFNGDGLAPLSTEFFISEGLTTDVSGDLLVVDSGNGRVRKITATTVETIAGGYIGDGTTAARSDLNGPTGIAFDKAGNVFVAENRNNRIRKISPAGLITTFAGTGDSGSSGDGGLATSATLAPWAVAADLNGNVFIADLVGGVRKVDSSGIISHLGGPSYPVGLSTDPAGNVYASGNPLVWKITPSGTATIFAGVANQYGYNGDGIPANQAYLSAPSGTAMDASGNFYIADAGNNRIRKVDINGIISTVAGNGTYGFSGDGGLATSAELSGPSSIAFDTQGNMYIADTSNYRVRVVNSSGVIRTLAGTGNTGYNGDNLAANKTNVFPYAVRC